MFRQFRGHARWGVVPALVVFALFLRVPDALANWNVDPYFGTFIGSYATAVLQDSHDHSACEDGSDGFFLAWQSGAPNLYRVYVQRTGNDGEPAPGWSHGGSRISSDSTEQTSPAIVSDGDGGAIVAWVDTDAGQQRVRMQRLTGGGQPLWGNGIVVATVPAGLQAPVLVEDGAHGAYVAWTRLVGLFDGETRVQHVLANGDSHPGWNPAGQALAVAGIGARNPALAADSSGGCWAVWQDLSLLGDFDIAATHLSASGSGTVGWRLGGEPICLAARGQTRPRVVTDTHGGPYFVWQDDRSASNDLYMLHLGAGASHPTGDALLGVPVAAGAGNQVFPQVSTGGGDALYVVWEDDRLGALHPFIQHLHPDGSPFDYWSANGIPLTQVGGDSPVLAADGVGGVYVVFVENATGHRNVRGTLVGDLGPSSLAWTSQGRPICTSPFPNYYPIALPDRHGNAFAVWWDTRNGGPTNLAQRIDRFGALGDAGPAITSIADVPGDQGGRVRMSFRPSSQENVEYQRVSEYQIYRFEREPSGSQTQVQIASLPPSGAATYAVELPTIVDSTGADRGSSHFYVKAIGRQIGEWSSAPDSGASVDNLAPGIPNDFAGIHANHRTILTWTAGTELDLAGYVVYRGPLPDFTHSPAYRIATVTAPGYVDLQDGFYSYQLTALDVHGNESAAAILIPYGVLDAGDAPPPTLEFALAGGNPCRGSAALRLGVPRAGRVRVALYDAAGRRVRTLADASRPAGRFTLGWDGLDDTGSRAAAGLYFARMEAAGEARVARILLVR